MSTEGYVKRSVDHLACWFSTGVDGAHRSSRAGHANLCPLDDPALSPSMQTTSSTLGLDQDADQRAVIGRVRSEPSTINRHSP